MIATVGAGILAAALGYARAGLSVLPIRADGSKQPDLATWTRYQERAAAEHELRAWFDPAEPPAGIGLACGRGSGGLELLDFDDEEAGRDWLTMTGEHYPEVLERLTLVRTPRPGLHVWYRVYGMDVPGNLALAWRPATSAELAASPKRKQRTLVETRGQGGQGLVPGGAVTAHENKVPYAHVGGPGFDDLAALSPAERDALHGLARLLDRSPPAQAAASKKPAPTQAGLPGEDYETRGSWAELLERHGWRLLFERGGVGYWQRPDKGGRGHSATLGHCKGPRGEPLLRVFSSSAEPFRDGRAYGLFNAYTILEHGGDHAAAAAALRGAGYGTPPAGVNGHGPRHVGAGGGADRRKEAARPKAAGRTLLIERPYVPFPTASLPPGLREMVVAVAAARNADPALVALPALAAAASCVGATHRVTPNNDWYEDCVLWTVPICESGTRKTPAYSAALDWLGGEQGRLGRAHLRLRQDYEEALADWQNEDRRGRGPRPRAPAALQMILTTDGTIEGIARHLQTSPRGVLYAAPEIDTWLESLTRYDNSTAGYFLAAYNASAMVVARADRSREPLVVPRGLVSITGTIQPGIIEGALTDRNILSGLLGRALLAMPPGSRNPFRRSPATLGELEAWGSLQEGLRRLTWADAELTPRDLRLSAPAVDLYEVWHNALDERLEAAPPGPVKVADNKLWGNCLRLALVDHLVSAVRLDADPNCPVGVGSVGRACALADWFSAEHARVYPFLCAGGGTAAPGLEERVLAYCRRRGLSGVSVRDLARALRDPEGTITSDVIRASLEVLAASGQGSVEHKDGQVVGFSCRVSGALSGD